MNKLLAAALLSLGLAAPAQAASFTVTGIGAGDHTPWAAVPGNDFQAQLAGEGAVNFFKNVGLSVSDWVVIEFFVVASESGFQNRFDAGAAGLGPVSFQEAGQGAANDVAYVPSPGWASIGERIYAPGAITDLFFSVVSGIANVAGCTGAVCGLDTQAFGIITGGPLYVSGASYGAGNSIAFAFDDDGAGPDDNHDDLIIYARIKSVIPEPATWSLMIGAFGLLGAATRRRRLAAA